MSETSDLLARIGGYLAARPQYARTFYADHPEVMLKEAADELAKLRADRERLRAVLTATCNSLDNAGLPNAAKMLRHELRPSGPAPGPIDPPLGSNNVKHHYKPSRYGPCRECGYPASEMLMHYPRAALTPPSPEVR